MHNIALCAVIIVWYSIYLLWKMRTLEFYLIYISKFTYEFVEMKLLIITQAY